MSAGYPNRVALLLGALWLPLAAQAQSGVLSDPTRPPSASAQAGVGEVEAGGPVVQSIIIPAKGKPSAVINGERVILGGKFGEDRVVRITDGEVVLEGSGGRQTLKLIPGVDKIVRKPARVKKTGSAEK